MAHALLGYDGPCKNIHGHSYKLEVTIIGNPIESIGNSKLGMVMDFTDLKAIVSKYVLNDFDHATILNQEFDHATTPELSGIIGKLLLVPYQPTCENMLVDIRNRILPHLPKSVVLHSIRLDETASSYAEIHESDNL